jgi:hypothetical protein
LDPEPEPRTGAEKFSKVGTGTAINHSTTQHEFFILFLGAPVALAQLEIRAARRDIVHGLADAVDLALVDADGGVGHLLVADLAGLLHLLVHGLDVLVQVGDGEGLAAVRALRALVIVNLQHFFMNNIFINKIF